MALTISGDLNEKARIVVINESNWTTEYSIVYPGYGEYEIPNISSGNKTIVAVSLGENNAGQSYSYCNVEGKSSPNTAALYSWGYNSNGQLGIGSTTPVSSPVQIGSNTNWLKISCGRYHNIGMRDDGTIWGWGNNGYGQLGMNHRANRNTPYQIGTDTNWLEACATGSCTFFIKLDRTMWSCGHNYYGQLGLGNSGSSTDRSSPVQVGSDADWYFANGGYSHTIASKVDGTILATGEGRYGQLGTGGISDRASFTDIGSLTDWIRPDCSDGETSMAIKTDGSIWVWGNGWAGDGTTTSRRSSPVQVGADKTWVEMADGDGFKLAIADDGTLWSWGNYNSNGELGHNDRVAKSVPTQVGSLTDWAKVACGRYTSYAVKTDGTFWTWGYNFNGELGLGTNGTGTYKSSPVQVGSDTDWVDVEAGISHVIAKKGS